MKNKKSEHQHQQNQDNKNIINRLKSFFHKFFLEKLLLFLLFFVIGTRTPYLLDNAVAFGFDHGKDSLAVLHMILLRSPKLIGPWTSIPGLYFGPGWYYLLAPAYFLTGLNPVSAVYVMILLLLIQVFLAYKFFGKIYAIIITSAPFWLIISTSAWNPFPMPLLTLVILIVLDLVKKDKRLSLKRTAVLGIASSLGFHFSTAYAIFYPVAILGILFFLKPKVSIKTVLSGIAGFIMPFIPQILFELRHDFIQTKGVVNFLFNKEAIQTGSLNFFSVFKATVGELSLGFIPELKGFESPLTKGLILSILFFIAISSFWTTIKKQSLKQSIYYFLLIIFFILIPCVGFSFLHFNVWYTYAMLPVIVLIVVKIINSSPTFLKIIYCLLLLLTPVFALFNYYEIQKDTYLSSRAFLPVKQQALSIIRQKSNSEPFASFHFVPDIYDFSYQYLYFMQAHQGYTLPSEFAYKPDAVAYIVQKEELLKYFNYHPEKPQRIFFVVEKTGNPQRLAEWWDDQQYSEIVEEVNVSEELVVYVAKP